MQRPGPIKAAEAGCSSRLRSVASTWRPRQRVILGVERQVEVVVGITTQTAEAPFRLHVGGRACEGLRVSLLALVELRLVMVELGIGRPYHVPTGFSQSQAEVDIAEFVRKCRLVEALHLSPSLSAHDDAGLRHRGHPMCKLQLSEVADREPIGQPM